MDTGQYRTPLAVLHYSLCDCKYFWILAVWPNRANGHNSSALPMIWKYKPWPKHCSCLYPRWRLNGIFLLVRERNKYRSCFPFKHPQIWLKLVLHRRRNCLTYKYKRKRNEKQSNVYARVYGCVRWDLPVDEICLYGRVLSIVEVVVDDLDDSEPTVLAVDDDRFFPSRRLVWSTINGHRMSDASVFTTRSCSLRDLIVEDLFVVVCSRVRYRSLIVSLLLVDLSSVVAAGTRGAGEVVMLDWSVSEFQNSSLSSSGASKWPSAGSGMSSNVILLIVWYGTAVSLMAVDAGINCDDDEADWGGDRNVSLWEMLTASTGGLTATDVDRLNQSVRNFPSLWMADRRWEISVPSTLIKSSSCRR